MKSLSGVELFGSAHLKLFTFLARHSALHYNNIIDGNELVAC